MPRLLSRIEREYILEHMAETLPALSVLCALGCVDVADGAYRVDRECIVLSQNEATMRDLPDGMACEVRFSHKKRALSFKSTVSASAGALKVAIADDVRTSDERERKAASCAMKARFSGAAIAFVDSTDFPLELDFVKPEDAASSARALDKVLDRLGIDGSDGYGRAAAQRLSEFFERVKAGADTGQWTRTALLVDGSTILVTIDEAAVAKYAGTKGSVGADIPVTLECGTRLIECVCRLSGSVPVSRGLSLACLAYADIKPEDQRFLHERAHREKFIG
jgi:hypothetical protein